MKLLQLLLHNSTQVFMANSRHTKTNNHLLQTNYIYWSTSLCSKSVDPGTFATTHWLFAHPTLPSCMASSQSQY